MVSINLNWFLGVLAIELWIAPYVIVLWPEISAAWYARRAERLYRRLERDYALSAAPLGQTIYPPARVSSYT
jgi:hypothetical protein